MTTGHSRAANRLRVIGGRWRGRKLEFPSLPGLRPTPDRVRETLFNWLAPVIEGARCLDLFAGSGALGLEAASRGAAEVLLVDASRVVTDQLRANVARLNAAGVTVIQADALAFLEAPACPFDIVFLDPPYRQGLLAPACARLEAGGWLKESARVYLEQEREEVFPALPAGWVLLRSKTAGQMAFHLVFREGRAAARA
jgi:16S rRNA (guanine966-N2)-methyltransferase